MRKEVVVDWFQTVTTFAGGRRKPTIYPRIFSLFVSRFEPIIPWVRFLLTGSQRHAVAYKVVQFFFSDGRHCPENYVCLCVCVFGCALIRNVSWSSTIFLHLYLICVPQKVYIPGIESSPYPDQIRLLHSTQNCVSLSLLSNALCSCCVRRNVTAWNSACPEVQEWTLTSSSRANRLRACDRPLVRYSYWENVVCTCT